MDAYDIHFRDINRSTSGEYSRDGVIDAAKWSVAKPKILYVLKQTAGYEGSRDSLKGWSIVEELKREGGWLSPGVKASTYKKIAKLSWLLIEAMKRGEPLATQESKKMGTQRVDLYEAISNSAIINICKHSGEQRSNNDYILDQGMKNSMIIRQQMDELEPDVIIAGSDVVWRCLSNTAWGICKDMILSPVKRHESKRFGAATFYHANHPSAWTGGGFDAVKIQKQIFEILQDAGYR